MSFFGQQPQGGNSNQNTGNAAPGGGFFGQPPAGQSGTTGGGLFGGSTFGGACYLALTVTGIDPLRS